MLVISLQVIIILTLSAVIAGVIGGLVYGWYDTAYYHSKRKEQLENEIQEYRIASMKLAVLIDRLLRNYNHGAIG